MAHEEESEGQLDPSASSGVVDIAGRGMLVKLQPKEDDQKVSTKAT